MARPLSSLTLDSKIALFSPTLTVIDVGSTAVRAIVSGADKIAVRKRIYALAKMLDTDDVPGVSRLVPTNDSLLVEFDPALVEAPALKRLIKLADASASSGTESAYDSAHAL